MTTMTTMTLLYISTLLIMLLIPTYGLQCYDKSVSTSGVESKLVNCTNKDHVCSIHGGNEENIAHRNHQPCFQEPVTRSVSSLALLRFRSWGTDVRSLLTLRSASVKLMGKLCNKTWYWVRPRKYDVNAQGGSRVGDLY